MSTVSSSRKNNKLFLRLATQQACRPAPIPPVDGAVGNPQSTWLVDDVVVYNCNPGFEIVGASTAFCLNTGVFDPPAPRCVGTYKAKFLK